MQLFLKSFKCEDVTFPHEFIFFVFISFFIGATLLKKIAKSGRFWKKHIKGMVISGNSSIQGGSKLLYTMTCINMQKIRQFHLFFSGDLVPLRILQSNWLGDPIYQEQNFSKINRIFAKIIQLFIIEFIRN